MPRCSSHLAVQACISRTRRATSCSHSHDFTPVNNVCLCLRESFLHGKFRKHFEQHDFPRYYIHYFLINAIGRFSCDTTGVLTEITAEQSLLQEQALYHCLLPPSAIFYGFDRNLVSEILRNCMKYHCCDFFSLCIWLPLSYSEKRSLDSDIGSAWDEQQRVEQSIWESLLQVFPRILPSFSCLRSSRCSSTCHRIKKRCET